MSFYQHPGTIEIFTQVPDGAPQHPAHKWNKFDVDPSGGRMRVTVAADHWTAEVKCRRVKKDGKPSEITVFVEFNSSDYNSNPAGPIPQYVIKAVEHAKRVHAVAFPATAKES